ncbi:DUF262 domain-containing protein [Microbacterium deminutum]|uniref:DUF262 domain-containing protein n=1 Tax=Microbacterium deminutum TaxID=344164 RepID=A0ABN2RLA2_9MICO
MHAEEIEVEKLFSSDRQLLIPLWQRRYSWKRSEWQDLWLDLVRVATAAEANEKLNHFIGSVVLHAQEGTGMPSEAQRFLVVDGQQRITTLTLLICAIRDHIARSESDDPARQALKDFYTSRYLRNTTLGPEYRDRLVLQQADRSALTQVIDGVPGDQTLVEQAYQYFSTELSNRTSEQALTLITHIAKRLSAVWVVLEAGDNAHRVFQTLNSGGRPLEQADLVRNFFFLLLGEEGEQFYSEHWQNLEADVPPAEIEDYLVAWAISQGHGGSKGALFAYFQKDLGSVEGSPTAVYSYGQELTGAARLFRYIRRPGEMSGISVGTRRSLLTLSRWGTVPAEGLVLHLLRRFTSGAMDDSQLGLSIEIVLSFFARRFLAGYAPNRHKSILVRAAHKLTKQPDLAGNDVVALLRAVLSGGEDENSWPSDAVLRDRVTSTPVYTPTRSKWAFLVLERINRTFYAYEAHVPNLLGSSDYTVEHVMPQTLSLKWEHDLVDWGVESPAALHETHLHVLGNLTLSAINSHLHNRPLPEKLSMLEDDTSFKINGALLDYRRWDGQTIDSRGLDLIERAIDSFVPPLSREEIQALGIVIDEGEVGSADEDDEEEGADLLP